MMSDPRKVPTEALQKLVVNREIDKIPLPELIAFIQGGEHSSREDKGMDFTLDPRSGEAVVYNPARADRPHDYSPVSDGNENERQPCPICTGNTTGILDLTPLTEGFTFINKNLFPVFCPPTLDEKGDLSNADDPWGIHLVQWTSSFHDRDWQNMPEEDCLLVMTRLAAAERRLLEIGGMICAHERTDGCYVSVIKNYGAAVGGSLEHGHQQIALSSLAPVRILDNRNFEEERGVKFSEHLLRDNPSELEIRDYGQAVLLTSQYMRRPLEMILVLKDVNRSYLSQLDQAELLAVSRGWADAVRVIHKTMPLLGRETAYNVVTHNGPGAGLYFEFLPYTQETGGFELLGLSICQSDPARTADLLRAELD